MERNLENFFSEKIKVAEQKPVTWNKDTTWHLVTMSLEPERKRTPFFYAVACVLMLFVLAGVHIGNYQEDRNAHLTPLAASPIRPNSYQPIEEECKVIQQPVVNRARHTTQPLHHKSQPEQPVDNILPESSQTNDFLLAEESNETAIQEPLTSNEKKSMVQEVEPIIGVIIPEKQRSGTVTEKKVKFRWFKSPEPDTPGPPASDTKNLFARIN